MVLQYVNEIIVEKKSRRRTKWARDEFGDGLTGAGVLHSDSPKVFRGGVARFCMGSDGR